MSTTTHKTASLLLAVLLWAAGMAQGGRQDEKFEISRVEADEVNKYINLYVKAYDKNNAPLLSTDLSRTRASVRKVSSVNDTLEILEIIPIARDEVNYKNNEDPMSVLFLLDLSGSMRGEKLKKAKQAIRGVLDSDILQGCKIEFAWFHDLVSKSVSLSKDNFKATVDVVDVGPEGEGRDTDLFRAIKEKTTELSRDKGQKVLILLTDGKNDIKRNKLYREKVLTPITEDSILRHVSRLDSTVRIFPVGVGRDADENFLKELAGRTRNPNDSYSFGVAPDEIPRTFQRIARDISQPNFKIVLFPDPEDAIFRVEDRIFALNYTHPESRRLYVAQKTSVLGSATRPVDLRRTVVARENHFATSLIGFILLALLFVILSLSVPIVHRRQFKRKYVRKYRAVKRKDVRKKEDPLTLEPFEDDDDVVVNEKGDKMMKLSTWKYIRNNKKEHEVGDYAELFQLNAKSGDFFSQRGVFRQLNWLWFGALGGFLAWGISAILGELDWGWYQAILQRLDNLDEYKKQISTSVFNETLVGMAMGASVVGALATVEEIGQSRKFNVGRILVRMLIGLAASFLVFFTEATLIAKLIPFNYVGQLIGWTIFGTVMGLAITLFSSIEAINGLKGGLIAGLAAFHIYYFLNLDVINEVFSTDVTRMISYFCYGSILGYTLFTVVASLESFELRCLSPKHFSGWQSPVSKWLKSSSLEYIVIGRNPKNRVYIKWDDPAVKANHARLSLARDIPCIEPDEGQVLVNRRPVSGPTALKNGDQIQLGEKSISILQFVAKEGSPGQIHNAGGAQRSAMQVKKKAGREEIRKKIKITRRQH